MESHRISTGPTSPLYTSPMPRNFRDLFSRCSILGRMFCSARACSILASIRVVTPTTTTGSTPICCPSWAPSMTVPPAPQPAAKGTAFCTLRLHRSLPPPFRARQQLPLMQHLTGPLISPVWRWSSRTQSPMKTQHGRAQKMNSPSETSWQASDPSLVATRNSVLYISGFSPCTQFSL